MIQRVSFIIRLILVFDFIRKVAGGYIYFPTTYNMTLQSRVLAGRHDKTNSNIYYCNFPEFDIKCLKRSDFFSRCRPISAPDEHPSPVQETLQGPGPSRNEQNAAC